jgi:hypothetical protein
MSPRLAINLSGFYAPETVLNLTGFSKIYDSKPTVLSFCVAADVGMQILYRKKESHHPE